MKCVLMKRVRAFHLHFQTFHSKVLRETYRIASSLLHVSYTGPVSLVHAKGMQQHRPFQGLPVFMMFGVVYVVIHELLSVRS